jgi:hypothetical protein
MGKWTMEGDRNSPAAAASAAEEAAVVAGNILQWGKKVERGQALLKPMGKWKDGARWSSSSEKESRWKKWHKQRR